MNPLTGEKVLDLGNGGKSTFVAKATDPVAANVATPADFAAQFPTPLDPTEILELCEEVSLLRSIPEKRTGLKEETWREMTSLAFTSGSSYIGFADGACPEEYTHDGSNTTVSLKNIGAKKSLTVSDIMHSMAVIQGGAGIEALLAGGAASSGLPGGIDQATFARESIASLKEKEVLLGMTLVANGWDRLLAVGNDSTYPLEFDGIETQVVSGNGAHVNASTQASGTFAAADFDRFLSEACAKPTHIFGHPQAIQEMMSSYFQLGFAGSQVVNNTSGDRIIPGFNFGGFIHTGVGRLQVVADVNFAKTASGASSFQSSLYALRMTHNGEPLVYRATQIPLSLIDLTPGCTSISFEIWAKTALIIKAMCAQSKWTSLFSGRVTTTCTQIG